MKVNEAIKDFNLKDNEKKLELIKIREKIVNEREEARKELEKRTKELIEFDNADFDKIIIKDIPTCPYTWFLRKQYWFCGKIKGKERTYGY